MKKAFALAFLFLAVSAGSACAELRASVQVQEVVSPGGIKAWLAHDDKLPLISMRIAFRGGVEQDPADKQGLGELMASLLTQGAGPYDAQAFQQKLADESIGFTFAAGRDAVQGSLRMLRESRRTAFEFMRLAVNEPRFDDEAFERVRRQQITQIQAELGNASWQGRRAMFAAIFRDHPYGMRRLGTAGSLAGMRREDVQAHARRLLARDNLLVTVAGAITPEELGKALDQMFGNLPEHADLRTIPDFSGAFESGSLLIKREGTQTEMLLAMPMVRRNDPDWYAAEIVNYVLGGGGFASRLMSEVRDKEGLTYGIGTGLGSMDRAALLLGQASTDNDKTDRAWTKILDVWRGVYDKGLTEDEIAAAKDYLTGSQPLSLTSISAIANVLMEMRLENLGRDYLERRNALIRGVTAEDVRRVVKRWFDPSKILLVMVGEPEGLRPDRMQEQVRE